MLKRLVQAQFKLLNETIRRIMDRREENGEYGEGLLGIFLRGLYRLTDSQIADNLIGVIFAAHDTTASALTWVLKYLHDNANFLEAVTVIYIISFSLLFIFS